MNTMWISFYSVRGGVGRSTTLTLCALELARLGQRVAVVDFDLESPGLDILLTPEGAGPDKVPHEGVLNFLDARARGEQFEVERIILPRSLPGEYTGRLFLIPAGRCDDHYLSALDRLDLKQLYERSGLFNPVRALRAELEEVLEPDVVLVDSRTGYSDAALVSLFDLADVAVIVLVPDLQNVERLAPVLRRLVQASASKQQQILLVANKCQMTAPAMRAIADIEERLRELVPSEEYEDPEERPFLHKLPFESALTWAQRLLPPPVLSDAQRALGNRLQKLVKEHALPPAAPAPMAPPSKEDIPAQRAKLLERLRFGEDEAESDTGLLDAFLFASHVKESLRPERWLIRGRKGAGKSAFFRMLTERPSTASEHCPELKNWRVVAAHGDPWTGTYLRPEDFQIADQEVQAGRASWKDLWRLYAIAQAVRSFPELATTELRRDAAAMLHEPLIERPGRMRKLLAAGSHAWVQGLQELSGQESPGLLFVYDHLDAGFGSEIRDFSLRRNAVTGLLDAWTADVEPARPRMLPKLLLREDVFASLSLANVNRWRARDVELRWEFSELAECLVARARMDTELSHYLDRHVMELSHVLPEARAFVVLFDERVRHWEKQARTWLTARNRLTDVVGNLFPRDFMRLGVEALALEKQAPSERRYFASALIAGRHTLAAIPKVSERRVVDLKDEFSDYASLLGSLQGLRSPFEGKDILKRFMSAQPAERPSEEREEFAKQALSRLKEHGVIGDWEEAGRLFVPDLYLHGLGMYRSGW